MGGGGNDTLYGEGGDDVLHGLQVGFGSFDVQSSGDDTLYGDAGGDIGKIVYCPHHPDAGCDCRKPMPGLLEQLSRKYGVPLNNVPVVGDSVRDVDAALAVGARPVLVRTGNGSAAETELRARDVHVDAFADLHEAADALIEEFGRA